MKMADRCLNNWSRHSIPQSSSSSSLQTLASAISSPSSKRCSFAHLSLHRPAIFGTKLNSSESLRKLIAVKRAAAITATAAMDSEFSDEEFSKKIQELALRFQVSDDGGLRSESEIIPPEWPGDMIPASIERKANSVELPFSLRIIKKKKQGMKEASGGGFGTAYCSVKKAFSSMVFIIRELQSYTLQMRELLFYEDLQEILIRVQKELNASFVWLFQQVFSQTPTLMVYVMILLANYSVYSMSNNLAVAAVAPPPAAVEHHHRSSTNFDYSSSVKSFSVNSGKATSIGGGNGGGGGKFRSAPSGTDGEGRFDGSVFDPTRTGEESVSGQEEESWNSVVEEADRMRAVVGVDREIMKRFVSPVTVKVEEEDTEDHFRTELLYQTGLSQEPDNPLLLANYAQFLYVVARDYDRAEDYFKRASKVEPKDAEALSKYANFLWQIRKDLWAAEETYLEAISADPNNSFYAANYAHFLWSTGGEDTCYPLDSPETSYSEDA